MAGIVEDHPQRKQIESDILAGLGYRDIAARVSPYVSKATLQRYGAKFLKPAIDKHRADIQRQIVTKVTKERADISADVVQHETSRALAAQPFVARIERKYQRYERWMAGAEEKNDFKALASLDTAETRAIQLQAQLSGALDPAANQQVNLSIALMLPRTDVAPAPAPKQSSWSSAEIDIEPIE